MNIHRGPRLLVEALCAVLAFTDQRSHELRACPAFAILTYTAEDPFVVTVEAVSWRRLQFCWHLDRDLVSQAATSRGEHAATQVRISNPDTPHGPTLIVDAERLARFLADAAAVATPDTIPAS